MTMTIKKNKNIQDMIPLYSPRSTYNQIRLNDEKTISDMTLNFDKVTIQIMKKQFQSKNNQLKLQEFIILAKKHLNFWQPHLPDRQKIIILYLTKLFTQIDINGNGYMQWKQLTNYIIQKAIVLKNLKSKSEQIKRYVKSDLQPKLKVEGIIQKGQFIKDLDKMAFFQQGASKIHFMDLKDGSVLDKTLDIDPKKLIINISSIKKKKAGKAEIKKKDLEIPTEVRVLDILYLTDRKYKCLLVATSDGYVRGWKHTQAGFVLATQPDNEQEVFEHYFNSQIYSMAWDSVNEVLYCGQKNGSIYMWNLKTDLEKTLSQDGQITEKNQSNEQKMNCMITTMITMPKLQFMASGRMDGKVILWDTINNKKKWTYREHVRGVLSLAFNENMILLFSSGFDHKICVWNPYISTLIHKIETHLSPVLSLRVIESSNQLISLDNEGVVKITDTKRFHGIYSFLIDRNQTNQVVSSGCTGGHNLSSFIAIDRPLKLIFLGKSISIYEYDKNYNPHAADQNVVVSCRYIKNLLSFLTVSGNKVKLWSALNGDINKIFIDISQNEITAMGLDSLKKKIIIGDIQGNISVHNVLNGAKMKQLAKHNCQIFSIIGMKNNLQTEMLISCSIDNQIRIFKDNDDNYEIVRHIYFRKDIQITHLKYQTNINLMMIGTNVGKVGFYDAETGKNIGNFQNNNVEEVTSLCQTKESVVIATNSIGKITIFGVPPVSNRFEKILSYNHLDCEKTDNSTLGITASCYNEQMNYLYVLDDKNYLTCYDLSDIRQYKIGVKQANNQPESMMSLAKRWQKLKFKIRWSVKTNQELVKFAEYFQEQDLVCTSSFDKKVKLWNALTGEFIDSLQQNYNKTSPQPIAFYDIKNCVLFNKNRLKIIDQNVHIDISRMQYDSQQLEKVLIKYEELKQVKSSLEWNLKVDVKAEQESLKNKLLENAEKIILEERKNEKSRQEGKRMEKNQKKNNEMKNRLIKQMSSHFEQNNQIKKENFMNVSQNNFKNLQLQRSKKSIKRIKENLQKCKYGIKQVQFELNKQNFDSSDITDGMTNQSNLNFTQTLFYETKSNEFKQTKKSINQTLGNFRGCSGQKSAEGQKKVMNSTFSYQRNSYPVRMNNRQSLGVSTVGFKMSQKQARDYLPIEEVLMLKKKKKNFNENKRFIENLHKRQTLSIINSKQEEYICLGQQQAKAARKLCEVLLKIDETDKRPRSLLKNIKIKQVSKSMHNSINCNNENFPKIN